MAESHLPGMGVLLMGAAATLARRGSMPPDTRLCAHYQSHAPSEQSLLAYRAYFGATGKDVPLTALYPLAQRAHLALMLRGDFPLAVPGMVHVSNEMRLVGPVTAGTPVSLEAACEQLPAPGPAVRLAFEATIHQAGVPVVTCRSVYQARRKPGGPPGGPRPEPEALQPLAESREVWRLGADEGRRYARLSGDYNPIHLSSWLSRGFGFARPILHGMNAVARAQTTVARETGRVVTSMGVEFKRPVALPAEAVFAWGGGGFALASGEGSVRHLTGWYGMA